MPAISPTNSDLNYQLDGPANAPVLVLSNSLGANLHMWDAQIPLFAEHFRVLRYDTRGHGQSLVSPGSYTIEQSARDVLALLDALDVQKAHFCGLSMGGLIGQWLGINAPERIERLVLCNTAAKIGSEDVWNIRIDTVLKGGERAMLELGDASIERWFTAPFAKAEPAKVEPIVRMLVQTSPQGYAGNCAALRDADLREQIAAIKAPTLIVCGTGDVLTTLQHGRFMQERIAGAELVDFDVAHLSNIEAGELFTQRVLMFLQGK